MYIYMIYIYKYDDDDDDGDDDDYCYYYIYMIYIYDIYLYIVWSDPLDLSIPAEPNVRPRWHHISHFHRGFTACFIRGSNRLAGMDGTLGVAPRHAYDTKFSSRLVSQ